MPSPFIQWQIDWLLEQAAEAIERSDWALMRDRASKVLALDPDNADAAHLMTAAERVLADHLPPSLPSEASSPSPTPTAPTSFAAGRYEVLSVLG